MELDPIRGSKADFLLQGALARTQGNEVVQVLLYLAAAHCLFGTPLNWNHPKGPSLRTPGPRRTWRYGANRPTAVWMVILPLRELGLRGPERCCPNTSRTSVSLAFRRSPPNANKRRKSQPRPRP